MKFAYCLALLIISLSLHSSAQDTTFYNNEGKSIKKRKNAETIKIVTKTDTGFVAVSFDKNGTLKWRETFSDPELKIKDGYSISYVDGKIDCEGRYKNNFKDGVWKYYHANGNVAGIVTHKKNGIINQEYFTPTGSRETNTKKIEAVPAFPGGLQLMYDYIRKNVKYPVEARKNKISGTVKLAFIIERDGKVTNVRVVESVDQELDREALRVVNNLPDFSPGIQFNRPVRVSYRLPISFNL